MQNIKIEYEIKNDKWYLCVDGVLVGKHYTLKEATKQVLLIKERGG